MFGRICVPPEDVDTAEIYGMVGEDIHRQIQALPGRVAADGCRANDDSGEVGRLLLQQERFAETFVLVVVRDGHQWVVFGDVLNLADPVDARRTGSPGSALATGPRFMGTPVKSFPA